MAQLIVSGNATASQVLTGSTFSAGALNGVSGNMPNNGAVNRTPSNAAQNIPAGYTTGGTVDAVVVPAANVLTGTTIAGTAGTMPNNGAPTWTPNTANQTLAAGYFSGGTVQGDANLVAANILSGKTIFGVAGNVTARKFASGSAAAGAGQPFTNSANTSVTMADFTVSGLTFQPNIIIVQMNQSFTVYNANSNIAVNSPIGLANSSNSVNYFQMLQAASVTATGFTLPVWNTATTYSWYAFG